MANLTIQNYSRTSTYALPDGQVQGPDGPNANVISLNLVSQNAPDYTVPVNENFLYLLENFASQSSGPIAGPSKSIKGQLWYDTATSPGILKVNDSAIVDTPDWKPITSVVAGNVGELQFNDGANSLAATSNLTYFTGNGVLRVSSLAVTSAANITGDVRVTGNANVSLNINVTGNAAVTGNVVATANVSGGNLNTVGRVVATGNVVGGNLVTAGNVTAKGSTNQVQYNNGGNLSTAGSLSVTGNATVTANISGGNISTGGALSVTGNAAISGNLSGANISTAGNLAVTGVANVTGNIVGAAGANITGNITGGNISTGGILTVTGNTVLNANASVAGNLTVSTSANIVANLRVGTSVGIGTAPTGNAGELVATGNVIAFFSDDRLKTRLGNIENALDKVSTLATFYFEPNQTAVELGYTVGRDVGISAQELQAVLPEAIGAAPISNNYLAVKHDRITPLIIAAIKELRDEIIEIKKKIG